MVDVQALRSEVTSDVVNRLATGESVRLVGLPLSGRSFVLAGAAARLRSLGFTVFVVQGRPSRRHEPLGALVLSGADVGRGEVPDRIGFAAAWLSRTLQHSGVLLIDDVPQLDDASSAVIATVSARHRVPIRAASSREQP